MRVAALYDIHGMLDALEAVLAEVEREDVDAVVLGGDVVVSGHTHMQFDRTVDGIRWANAGSVGMAYEGEIAAFWALLGPDVSFRKTPFDVEAAIEALLASGWPDAPDHDEVGHRSPRSAASRSKSSVASSRVGAARRFSATNSSA